MMNMKPRLATNGGWSYVSTMTIAPTVPRQEEIMCASPSVTAALAGADSLAARYRTVRGLTEQLCTPLALEDYVVQSMPDASPVKWHLAHTSWFFETFVLQPGLSGYHPFASEF